MHLYTERKGKLLHFNSGCRGKNCRIVWGWGVVLVFVYLHLSRAAVGKGGASWGWIYSPGRKSEKKPGTQGDPIKWTNWFRNLRKDSQSRKSKKLKIQWTHYHYFNLSNRSNTLLPFLWGLLGEMTGRIKCIVGFKISKNIPGGNLCGTVKLAPAQCRGRGYTDVQYSTQKNYINYPRAPIKASHLRTPQWIRCFLYPIPIRDSSSENLPIRNGEGGEAFQGLGLQFQLGKYNAHWFCGEISESTGMSGRTQVTQMHFYAWVSSALRSTQVPLGLPLLRSTGVGGKHFFCCLQDKLIPLRFLPIIMTHDWQQKQEQFSCWLKACGAYGMERKGQLRAKASPTFSCQNQKLTIFPSPIRIFEALFPPPRSPSHWLLFLRYRVRRLGARGPDGDRCWSCKGQDISLWSSKIMETRDKHSRSGHVHLASRFARSCMKTVNSLLGAPPPSKIRSTAAPSESTKS